MAQQKIWNMSRAAKGQSERWIRQQYNAAIKAANDRIKTVSQEKYQGRAQAYEFYVKGDLDGAPYTKQRGGMTVFKALPRGADREQALEALRMAERFLGAKTSTARGIQEVENERISILNDFIKENFQKEYKESGGEGEAPAAPVLTKTEADNILRWLGSEEGKKAKEKYDSDQVREAMSKAVIADRKNEARKAATDLYEEFKAKQFTLADWINSSENNIAKYKKF